ncbi:MAG: BlaI/MecI/CopY family transcriptional regulator [Tannerellaceae bacterium]|jgi:predicted transcriptional regulator|nr:BlaI/MecI/CopY family transcriptional regulator [Tannerellaceae bacterium]
MEKLTAQEDEVMRRIWQYNAGSVKEIRAKFPEPQPPYTTIASVVKNLERKGYVKVVSFGNSYVYSPLISESDYKQMFMGNVVRNYFENSYKDMVSYFVKERKISPEELKDIIDRIEKGEG